MLPVGMGRGEQHKPRRPRQSSLNRCPEPRTSREPRLVPKRVQRAEPHAVVGRLEVEDAEVGDDPADLVVAGRHGAEGGSAVYGEWEQTSKNPRALIGVTTMRFIGPRFLSSYYKRVYDGL